MPGRNGGTLKRGGVNPGAGRPTDKFRQRMQAHADRKGVDLTLKEALDGGLTEHFWKALHYATDHGYGKAVQAVDVTSGGATIEYAAVIPPPITNVEEWAKLASSTLKK